MSGAAQHLPDPKKADCFLTELYWDRCLGQTERAGFGPWRGARVPDNLRMRLQTDGQRRRPLREHSTKSIFICFQVMLVLELPVLERPQRERQTRSFRKHVFVIMK